MSQEEATGASILGGTGCEICARGIENFWGGGSWKVIESMIEENSWMFEEFLDELFALRGALPEIVGVLPYLETLATPLM